MKKYLKKIIYKSLDGDTINHYSATRLSLLLLNEGEYLSYDCIEVLPEQIDTALKNGHSQYSTVRDWSKYYKKINISDLSK